MSATGTRSLSGKRQWPRTSGAGRRHQLHPAGWRAARPDEGAHDAALPGRPVLVEVGVDSEAAMVILLLGAHQADALSPAVVERHRQHVDRQTETVDPATEVDVVEEERERLVEQAAGPLDDGARHHHAG